ncbi:hypothetical protein [Streptomyces sp. NPDC056192]|uniref:hypothetical protein n=1 Tax=unclassified Streptomyces TaxID=2593676 RepID=UPI0035E0EE52
MLVRRWCRERGCVHCLARDAGISQATGCHHLREAIDVLAERAPDLHQVLDRCRREGMTHVILDGTLIEWGPHHIGRDQVSDMIKSGWAAGHEQTPMAGSYSTSSTAEGNGLDLLRPVPRRRLARKRHVPESAGHVRWAT